MKDLDTKAQCLFLTFEKKIMKVRRPLKEIKAMCKAQNVDVDVSQIDKVLEFYEDYIADRLIQGEEIRINNIGKISHYVQKFTSKLPGRNHEEYETVRFKFAAFDKLKTQANARLEAVKKKHL